MGNQSFVPSFLLGEDATETETITCIKQFQSDIGHMVVRYVQIMNGDDKLGEFIRDGQRILTQMKNECSLKDVRLLNNLFRSAVAVAKQRRRPYGTSMELPEEEEESHGDGPVSVRRTQSMRSGNYKNKEGSRYSPYPYHHNQPPKKGRQSTRADYQPEKEEATSNPIQYLWNIFS